MITFFHGGKIGDCAYSLPAIQAICQKHSSTAKLGIPDSLYHNMKDFLKEQPVIEDVFLCTSFDGENAISSNGEEIQVQYNLNLFRKQERSYDHIVTAHLKAFDVDWDLTHPWLTVSPLCVADLVVYYSPKHTGTWTKEDYKLIKPYISRSVFLGIGTQQEDFMEHSGLDIPWHKTETFSELAAVISGAKLVIGNTTAPIAVAEGLKKPRILDPHPSYRNCFPIGDNGTLDICEDTIRRFL